MVTPTGILAAPLAQLSLTLAASSPFQTWVAAADAVQAEQSIYLIAAPEDAVAPYCVIDFMDDFMRKRASLTTGMPFGGTGSLSLYFSADIDSLLSDTDAAFTFLNPIGAIIEDLELLSGTVVAAGAPYTTIDTIQLLELGGTGAVSRKSGYDVLGAAFSLSVNHLS